MLSRRGFAGCVLCAGLGLIADDARAQGAPGFTRTILNRIEFPGNDMATIQVLVEVEPKVLIARHTHPGVETGYVLEGVATFGQAGKPDRAIATGASFQVPEGVPHLLQNGDQKSRILSIYVVDKNKPLASPAPE